MSSKNTPHLPTTSSAKIPATDTASISSRALFQGRQEICIEHADQIYRLRITRQGKLILTK